MKRFRHSPVTHRFCRGAVTMHFERYEVIQFSLAEGTKKRHDQNKIR